ncbi:MAG: TetR/AcrR family transcriptional regulator [Agrococcus casei]
MQARASHRIESLLDAAAAAIDAGGYETLTTQIVAERAGASIGTVYRYFPDRLAVIRGLAERNTERLLVKVDEVFAQELPEWKLYFRGLIDAFATLLKTEPGFRAVRTGDHIEFADGRAHTRVTDDLVERLWERVSTQFGLDENSGNRESIRVAAVLAIGLTYSAFSAFPGGDNSLLNAARRHSELEAAPAFS